MPKGRFGSFIIAAIRQALPCTDIVCTDRKNVLFLAHVTPQAVGAFYGHPPSVFDDLKAEMDHWGSTIGVLDHIGITHGV